MKLKIMLILALLSCFALSTCTSEWEPEAIGIGGDPSELKRSPCACMPYEFDRGLPKWFVDSLT